MPVISVKKQKAKQKENNSSLSLARSLALSVHLFGQPGDRLQLEEEK